MHTCIKPIYTALNFWHCIDKTGTCRVLYYFCLCFDYPIDAIRTDKPTKNSMWCERPHNLTLYN